MNDHTRFQVDPKLTTLLGENYRSSEVALKELVDNAWDADAECVQISLPDPMTGDPIVIKDDGCGMTSLQVNQEYLVIAKDRRSLKGDRTDRKFRQVKGRKGIGKFAGLMAADTMELQTWSTGEATSITLVRKDLQATEQDLESIPLAIQTATCPSTDHGTTITLRNLNQKFVVPSAERLKEIPVLDYGRQPDFEVSVNGQTLDVGDVPGEEHSNIISVEGVGNVNIRFTLSDNPIPSRHSGLVLRVCGKIVGKPYHFGLDSDEDVPAKFLKRVYGEVIADGLSDDEVTADWGAIIENSKGYQDIVACVKPFLKSAIQQKYKADYTLARARLEKETKRRLSALPEHRRPFAEQAFEKVMLKFYAESSDKIDTILSVVMDAFERTDYYDILEQIDNINDSDVAMLADSLSEFGLVDMSIVGQQAKARVKILDELDILIQNDNTLESVMHKSIENNLWILGLQYTLMYSNATLRRIAQDCADKSLDPARASKRPDLLLSENGWGHRLLIEFKRPNHSITRDDEAQAKNIVMT